MNYDHEQVSVKKPKDDADLSSDEAKEWIKCANDIEYFLSNYVWTQGQRGRVLFKPRKYQTRFYDALDNNDYVCLLSGRQSGKCSGKDSEIICRLNLQSLNTVVECKMRMEDLHEYARNHATGDIKNGLQEWNFIEEKALDIRRVQRRHYQEEQAV